MVEIVITVIRPETAFEPAGTEIYRGEFDENVNMDELLDNFNSSTLCLHWAKLKDA